MVQSEEKLFTHSFGNAKKKKKKREKTKNPPHDNPITVIVLSLFATKPCTSYINNMRIESKYFHGKKGRVVGHDRGGR